jgi:hypothetical protein
VELWLRGDGVGAVGTKRRRVVGVGIFTGGGLPFIGQRRGGGGRVPSMAGVEGVSMLPE